MEDIVWAELIVLATPIDSWYCAALMKNLLDRHYGLNKYYGSATGSLRAGKKVAILATLGYERDYAVEPFEMGMASSRAAEAVEGAKAFARGLLG